MEGATQGPGFLERIRARKKRREAEEASNRSPHSAWRENFVSIVVCSVFAFFTTTYVVHPMSVPTPSMEPTILVGDHFFVDKFSVRNEVEGRFPGTPGHQIRRGDIVVFKHPTDTENPWVKRVIGLPGETVQVKAKQVYVDGVLLHEPYKQHIRSAVSVHSGADFFGPVTVPAGHYFVMGDNRDNSSDSRFWGFLDRRLILGRPMVVLWSFDDPPNAHEIEGFERLKLYGTRILYFFHKTRWSRMGRVIG